MPSLTPYPTSPNDQAASSDVMPKIVSTTEAKARFSELMRWTVKHQDSVIIKSRGNPQAAIISYTEYEQLQRLKKQINRQEAISQLEMLAREIQANNQNITSEAADELADEITRAAIDSLVAKGEVQFTE